MLTRFDRPNHAAYVTTSPRLSNFMDDLMMYIATPQISSRRSVLAAALFLACSASSAQAQNDNRFSIRGFGTIGVVHSDNGEGDFVANLNQPSGPGRSRSWDATTDTKAGIQLDARLSDELSAVVQLTSRKRSDNNFTPAVEWANVKYQVTPELSIRAGRIALSTLMQSDARLVSYTLTAVRLPLEMYNIAPPTNSDGFDVAYASQIGNASNTLRASYGRTDIDLALGIPEGHIVSEVKARKIINVSDTVEVGALTLRASYFKSDLTVNGVTHRYNMKALGALYDAGAWFAQGELARSNGDGLTKDQQVWYALGGMRIKAFTPYVSYAKAQPRDSMATGAGFDQETSTLGVRWDFRAGTALKVQYDRISAPGVLATRGSGSYLVNQTSDMFLKGGKTNLVSVAVDFVF